LNLLPEFIRNIEGAFGEAGREFLARLPALIREAAQTWKLTDVQPIPTLSYNFVAFAQRGHQQVVLKMGVPNREFKSEMAALRLFHGEGACRLLDQEEEKYWMLLERLQPGKMLSTLEDDEEATRIASELMQKIWSPMESSGSPASHHEGAPGLESFIRLSDWFDGLHRLRVRFDGGTGPFEKRLIERAEVSVKNFFLENHRPVLMHGDFHHFNILSSERGWVVIDPKGVIGPAAYEVGPFLMNPWGDLSSGIDYRRMTRRRIDILHERLGFERERLREWALAHAVLSAWWGMEERAGWEYSLQFAEMITSLDQQ
jgi:streptomycin 6-kinase